MNSLPNIVVVGGGAGGLELVTRLGHTLGKHNKAKIILVDSSATHLWKPLLHEVAAGTLHNHEDEVDYLTHASEHGYYFQRGSLVGLDRQQKKVLLASVKDEQAIEVIPARTLNYDYLVLAIGSVGNDFGTPGVSDHCLFLDDYQQANHFHQQFISNLMQAQYRQLKRIDIAIVGAGATGVELAAELFYSVRQAKAYGLDKIQPEKDVHITLIEAANRILPALAKTLSTAVTQRLEQIGVRVLTGERVSKVTADGFELSSGKFVPAALKVWAAGVKAPPMLQQLSGLETHANNQLIVKDTLQTTRDSGIFAFGDCAYCLMPSGKAVPPRAQAAHQQAKLLARSLTQYLQNKPLLPYQYKDYGSLITLSKHEALGNLMGKMTNVFIEGKIARVMYLLLYKNHQTILHGWWRVLLLTIANGLTRKSRPKLKLH